MDKIIYFRASKQTYWRSLQKQGLPDDIMVGGDNVPWEFGIRTVDGVPGVRVEMFDDAVDSLNCLQIVSALKDLKGCESLDAVEEVLNEHGIEGSMT